ncbi:MAG: hypothetical protein ABUK01_16245 [Leptospirales bacterium]
MKTDREVKIMILERNKDKTIRQAAAAGNMCEKSAQKYLKSGLLPSQTKSPRKYRTRADDKGNPAIDNSLMFATLALKHGIVLFHGGYNGACVIIVPPLELSNNELNYFIGKLNLLLIDYCGDLK